MEKIVCGKCGSEAMIVSRSWDCSKCQHNGFEICDDDIAKELCVDDCVYIYDENIRKKAGEVLGFDIERQEVANEGACEISNYAYGEGCTVIECKECGERVEVIPYMGGC